MTHVQDVSSRLLTLERAARSGHPARDWHDQWNATALEWMNLAREGNDKRRFLRFAHRMRVRLRIGDERREVDMVEIGNRGLQIRGDLGKTCRPGDRVQWEAVLAGGEWVDIGAECEVVRKTGRWRAGLALAQNQPEVLQRIHLTAYYPAYIETLEAMAAGRGDA